MSGERCKEAVYHARQFRPSRCERVAVRDGFCTQHHPDTVAARRAKALAADKERTDREWRDIRRRAHSKALADLIVRDADAGSITPEIVDAWVALARRAVEGLE